MKNEAEQQSDKIKTSLMFCGDLSFHLLKECSFWNSVLRCCELSELSLLSTWWKNEKIMMLWEKAWMVLGMKQTAVLRKMTRKRDGKCPSIWIKQDPPVCTLVVCGRNRAKKFAAGVNGGATCIRNTFPILCSHWIVFNRNLSTAQVNSFPYKYGSVLRARMAHTHGSLLFDPGGPNEVFTPMYPDLPFFLCWEVN